MSTWSDRWRIGLACALSLIAASAPTPAVAQDLALPIVLDPPLTISPGDVLFGSYQVARRVNGPSVSIKLTDVLLGYLATCPDGTSGPIFIPLPDATLTVAADSQVWSPGDPIGRASAPDVCHGQTYEAPAMLLQVGELDSDGALDALRVRVQLGPTESWSAERTVLLAAHTPTPTPTATDTATPSTTPSATPSPTSTATITPSPTSTATITPSPTSTATITPSPTQTDTLAPTTTATPTDTLAPTFTPGPP